MMRKCEKTEFDLMVRAKLADAEEKVPSGVWKAVSARMAAEQHQEEAVPVDNGRSFGRFLWPTVGLAFASLAAAFLIFRQPNAVGTQPAAVGLQTSAPAGQLVSQACPSVAQAAAVAPASAVGQTVSENTPASAYTAAPAVSANQDNAAGSKAPASPVNPAESTVVTVDPFAMMQAEDSRMAESRPLKFRAGGSIAGIEDSRSVISSRSSGIAVKTAGSITETTTSTYGIPFTVGIGVSKQLTKRLSLGTGLDFSLLTRSFTGIYTDDAGVDTESDINHYMSYLGIPLNLYFTIIDTPTLLFYAVGGGEAEYCISNRYNVRALNKKITDKVSGLQFSLSLGLGVEFKLSDKLGLYVDPGVNYYFNCKQPKSVRTDHPLMFNLDAGLRFNF